jgi:hypothetical protein
MFVIILFIVLHFVFMRLFKEDPSGIKVFELLRNQTSDARTK